MKIRKLVLNLDVMILGHQRQLAYLNKVLKRGRLSHAYLFCGSEHVGKFTIAKEIAKVFYCETKKTIEDLCPGCRFCRMVEGGSHPNVYVLDPEHSLRGSKEDRKEIAIDDIRKLKRIFSLRSAGGKMRVVIVNKAEKMSQEAANAFLKLLEEAPESSLFLLVSSDRELLLPTIVSRTQSLFFSLAPRDTLEKFVVSRGVKDDRLKEEILNLADGRSGIACNLLNDQDFLDEERELSREIHFVLQHQLPDIFLLSEKVAFDESRRSRVIRHLLGMFRQELKTGANNNVLPLVAKIKNVLRIARMIETTNVNPRLALDVMLMEAGL